MRVVAVLWQVALGVVFTALPELPLASVVLLTSACAGELERRTAEGDEAKIAGLARAAWAPRPSQAQ